MRSMRLVAVGKNNLRSDMQERYKGGKEPKMELEVGGQGNWDRGEKSNEWRLELVQGHWGKEPWVKKR